MSEAEAEHKAMRFESFFSCLNCFQGDKRRPREEKCSEDVSLMPKLSAQATLPSNATADRASSNNAQHRTNATSQTPIEADNAQDSIDLWTQAYLGLEPSVKKRLEKSFPLDKRKESEWIDDFIKIVNKKEDTFKETTPALQVGEKSYIWRHYARRVVTTATCIGDFAIQFAPAPSPIIWSGLKTLLAANATQCEDIEAIFGCADKVLSVVRVGKVYEAVYLSNTTCAVSSAALEELRSALVASYAQALKLLAHADKKLQEGAAKQFLIALTGGGNDGKELVSSLVKAENTVSKVAQACHSNYSHAVNGKQLKLLKDLEVPLKLIGRDMQLMFETMQANEVNNVLEYISSVKIGDIHLGQSEIRTAGTCQWLLDHNSFRTWEESGYSSILWLNGTLGTGKSILTSTVIDRYRRDDGMARHDEGFAYFYCRRTDATQPHVYLITIYQSYIRQLARWSNKDGSLHKTVKEHYTRAVNNQQQQFTRKVCEELLIELAKSYPKITLVLDALDECLPETRTEILSLFKNLIKEADHPVKVFFSSRVETDIEIAMAGNKFVKIGTEDNKADIDKYLAQEITKQGYWANLSQADKKFVRGTILDKSMGMFRWAALQWGQLKKLKVRDAVLDELKSLPKDLTDTYRKLYDENTYREKLLLQNIIKWVKASTEAISAEALLAAVQLDVDSFEKGKDFASPVALRELEDVSRNFVTYDERLDIWKFEHLSVLEFFEEQQTEWMETSDENIAILMLHCLIQGYTKWPLPEDSKEADTFLDASPSNAEILDPRNSLQEHVRKNFILLLQRIATREREVPHVSNILRRFLGEESPQMSSPQYRSWANHVRRRGKSISWQQRQDLLPCNKSIFGIVVFGFHELLQDWWRKDIQVLATNAEERDLLAIAASHNHTKLCGELLDLGSEINRLLDQRVGCPLNAAVAAGAFQAAEFLLQNGADLTLPTDPTTLDVAVGAGTQFIDLLIKYKVDVNIQGKGYAKFSCALSTAGYRGNVEIAESLISNGADVNLQVSHDCYGTPLIAAAYGGSLECVKLFVESGADVNAVPEHGEYRTALGAALLGWGSSEEILRYLFTEAHADVNVLRSNLPKGGFRANTRHKRLAFLVRDGHVPLEVMRDIRQLNEDEYW